MVGGNWRHIKNKSKTTFQFHSIKRHIFNGFYMKYFPMFPHVSLFSPFYFPGRWSFGRWNFWSMEFLVDGIYKSKITFLFPSIKPYISIRVYLMDPAAFWNGIWWVRRLLKMVFDGSGGFWKCYLMGPAAFGNGIWWVRRLLKTPGNCYYSTPGNCWSDSIFEQISANRSWLYRRRY